MLIDPPVAALGPATQGRAPLPFCLTASMKLGRVVSVSGGRVVVLLDRAISQDSAGLQVGSLVKVVKPASIVFGIVEGMSIPIPRSEGSADELRVMEVNMLGEARDDASERGHGRARLFHRGVSSVPTLGDIVHACDTDDTAAVYALPGRQAVQIGTVHQDSRVLACLSVDDLLSRHFAIVGTTGSGKSCALALVLGGVVAANPRGHVLLLDPHGEYGEAFGDAAENLSVSHLQLPYWALNLEEVTEVFFGTEREAMQAEAQILRQLILKARLSYAQGKRDVSGITVDTPTPYLLAEVTRLLDEEMGRMDNRAVLTPYIRVKSRLLTLQADPRYSFMFPKGLAMRDNLSVLLGQLFRVPSRGKPICVLDLVGAPGEILNVVVAVICRIAFDLAVSCGHRIPLLLVCEEAHRYAPQDSSLGFEPAKRSLARIAKEGRKYGISLGVVSQRPSDLDVSVLSQCGTVLSFRMLNDADQAVIQAALTDTSAALVTSLPLLGNGEAVAIGEGVAVPMRLRLNRLPPERRPRSNSATFSRRWQDDEAGITDLDLVVEGWRGAVRG